MSRKVRWNYRSGLVPSVEALLTELPVLKPTDGVLTGDRNLGGFKEDIVDGLNVKASDLQAKIKTRLNQQSPSEKTIKTWLDNAKTEAKKYGKHDRRTFNQIYFLRELIAWMEKKSRSKSFKKPRWGERDVERKKILEKLDAAAANEDKDIDESIKNELKELRLDRKRINDFASLAKEEFDALSTDRVNTSSSLLRKLAVVLVLYAYASREFHPELPLTKKEDPRLVGSRERKDNVGAALSKARSKKAAYAKARREKVTDVVLKGLELAGRDPPPKKKRPPEGGLVPNKKTKEKIHPDEKTVKKRTGRPPRVELIRDAMPDDALRYVAFRAGAERQDRKLLYTTLRREVTNYLKFLFPSDTHHLTYIDIRRAAHAHGINLPTDPEKLKAIPKCVRPPSDVGRSAKAGVVHSGRSAKVGVVHSKFIAPFGEHKCLFFAIRPFKQWLNNELFVGLDADDLVVRGLIVVAQEFLTDLIKATIEIQKIAGVKKVKASGKTAADVIPTVFGDRLHSALYALGTRNRVLAASMAPDENSDDDDDIIPLMGPQSFKEAKSHQ